VISGTLLNVRLGEGGDDISRVLINCTLSGRFNGMANGNSRAKFSHEILGTSPMPGRNSVNAEKRPCPVPWIYCRVFLIARGSRTMAADAVHLVLGSRI
jgi:hypothetical protein